MIWNVKNDMPIGSAMPPNGISVRPAAALTVFVMAVMYLQTNSTPTLYATEITRNSFPCFGIMSPDTQLTSIENSRTKIKTGSPHA